MCLCFMSYILCQPCVLYWQTVCVGVFLFLYYLFFFCIFVIVHVRFVFGAYCDMSAEAILGEFVKVVK